MKKIKDLNVKEQDLEREALVAKKRIESILSLFKDISEGLEKIFSILDNNLIINEEITRPTDFMKIEHFDHLIYSKKRNKLKNLPERIWFNMCGIYLYIEFTIRYAKNDEKHLEGCFIYGMSYFIEKEKVEDKALMSFFIDNQGIIISNNDFEDESWTCDEKHLVDLHIRTLNKINEEALFIINKDKFE